MDVIVSTLVFTQVSQYSKVWTNTSSVKEKSFKEKLLYDLFQNYDPRVGALRNDNESVLVTFWMRLYQIIEVIEEKQAVVINTWVTEKWRDEYLEWNPLEYGNVTSVIVPYSTVWTPDTVLFSSINMEDTASKDGLNVKISMVDGRAEVQFLYPSIFSFSCMLNIQDFPFDTQMCTMEIGSWSMDSSHIVYKPGNGTVDLNYTIEHEEWALEQFEVRGEMVNYSCCPSPWSLVIFRLNIRRKPLHYIVNLIIPTIVICLVSLLGYFSPTTTSHDRTEKVTLGVTTLLAMAILLLNVSDKMPTTSNFLPAIGLFFLNMIILIAFGAGGAMVVVWLQLAGKKGQKPGLLLLKSAQLLRFLLRLEQYNSRKISVSRLRRRRAFVVENAKQLEEDAEDIKAKTEVLERFENAKHWVWVSSVYERLFLVLSILFLVVICLNLFIRGYV